MSYCYNDLDIVFIERCLNAVIHIHNVNIWRKSLELINLSYIQSYFYLLSLCQNKPQFWVKIAWNEISPYGTDSTELIPKSFMV